MPLLPTIAIAVAATTVVALPSLLVGGLAVLIQQELAFGEAALGTAIAASFAAGAIFAAPAGRLVERVGPRRTTWLGLACAAAALLGIGLLAGSWAVLLLLLVLAGIGVTVVQLGVNVLLARGVPAQRQGLAFGSKQAAVPFASFLAGIAVPTVGVTLGWRAAFLLAALLVPFVAWRMPDAPGRPRSRPGADGRDASRGTLVLLTVGVALASAGGNSTPAFIATSAVDRGLLPADAGLVLATGSAFGIAVRVGAGWLGDRLGRGSLLLVAGLVSAGAVGFAGLAVVDQPALIVVFTVLAVGGGWGWGGLIPLAVSRTNPVAPGRAMGIVQIGPMSGAVIGPLLFGTLAEHVAYAAAWSVMAVLAVAGVATILVARRELRRVPVFVASG